MFPLALDTETALITPECQAPALACVSITSRALGVQRLFHWTDFFSWIWELLTRPDVLIVGHNVAFDMAVLGAHDPSLLPPIFHAYNQDRITDTEIRAKLLDIAAGTRRYHEGEEDKAIKSKYNLDALSQRYLNRKLDKNTWRLRYGELRPFPLNQWPQGAIQYPQEDTRATDDLYWAQEQADPIFLVDQYRQSRAAFWIKLMSIWGIRTDAQGIFELAERTRQEYNKIAKDLRAAGLLAPDRTVRRRSGKVETVAGSRCTKAAQARIVQAYRAKGQDYPRTDTGLPALDEQACIDSGDDILIKYARLTSLGSIQTSVIPKVLERGLVTPIHSFFDSLKETGRTGSSDPNLQNLRRIPGIRECFVPRCLTCGTVMTRDVVEIGHCPGCYGPLCVFVTSDYSGLELATLAQVCVSVLGYSALAQALNAGLDPHLMIASQILGRPYEELKAIKDRGAGPDCVAGKSEEACSCFYCRVDNARQTGKVANFGFPGGLGAKSLVFYALANYGVRLTEAQAKDLKRIWLATWPEMKAYFKWINWHVQQSPPRIQQLFSGRWRGGLSYTEACNTMFQGLGADIAKSAGWEIAQGQYLPDYNPALFGTRTNLFVHDDFVLEAPEPRGHDVAMALQAAMISAAGPWLPDVKIGTEPLITRRMSRKAKPVKKDGRLVAWG